MRMSAREKIKQLNPDVLTLDVEMPKMDGITFLRNLMRLRPMPVVMVSSLTERGADVTLDALALGAVDYLSKPKIDLAATLKDYADELIEKIRIAARASVRALDPRQARAPDAVGPAAQRRCRAAQGAAAQPAAAHDRPHHRHRRLHRRHRGDQGSAHAAAAGLPGRRHRAAHSESLQRARSRGA